MERMELVGRRMLLSLVLAHRLLLTWVIFCIASSMRHRLSVLYYVQALLTSGLGLSALYEHTYHHYYYFLILNGDHECVLTVPAFLL